MTTLQTSSPHKARHLRFLPRRHPRWSNNAADKGRLRGARGSARVRARRAEDAPQSRRAEMSPVGAHAHLSAFRATETSGRPIRASEGTEISSWKQHAETEHTQISLPAPGAQRTVPGQDGQGRDLAPEWPPRADRSALPREPGCSAPSPSPARLRPSAPPRPGATLTARPVAALTLGSPASGIRVPIPYLPRACAGVAREAGAAAPPPRPSTAHRETRKERGGEGARGDQSRPSPGIPSARLVCAPPSPLPTLGGSRGRQLPGGRGRQGARRAGASDPRGGKLGGGRRRVPGPGRGCRARGRSLTCGSPAGAPGWGLPLGTDAARCGAPGTGRRLSGAGVAIPASHGRRRRLGSAARLGLPDSAGGAGSGWGRGRGRAPPGSAWGSGPRAGSAPERRARGSARGAPPARRESTSAPGGARTPTDPGAPCHRQPPTRTRADTADTGIHRRGTSTPTW